MIAAESGHHLCVEVLLKAGADPNKAGNKGETALMLAAQNGHDVCARVLLYAGANVEHALDDGFNSLLYAAENGHEQVARVLLEAKADPNRGNAGWAQCSDGSLRFWSRAGRPRPDREGR